MALLGQGRTPRFHPLLRVRQAGRHGRSGELNARDTRDVEQTLVVTRQVRDVLLDQDVETLRDDLRDRLQAARDTPGLLRLVQDVPAEEHIDHREQE